MSFCIFKCHAERCRTEISGDRPGIGTVGEHRNRNAAGAGSEVKDQGRGSAPHRLKSQIDQQFGLRARHQSFRAEPECKPVKLFLAGNPCHRLAGKAPFGQRLKRSKTLCSDPLALP